MDESVRPEKQAKRQLILVTGGNGFIGSHCVVELINSGYDVIVADNFINSVPECTKRVEQLVNRSIPIRNVNLTDKSSLDNLFKEFSFDHVIHFAALKAVGESVEKPLLYYQNNIISLLNLLSTMEKHKVKSIVYSSSCTVYGNSANLPISESESIGNCTSPYGRTKFISEMILEDLRKSDPSWSIISLRYFNPVGAHVSGDVGEVAVGTPNNLFPYVLQVASGLRPHVNVFGDDYKTKDGTGVRDYIHVQDLAQGHVSAIKKLSTPGTFEIYNLGSGQGYSVLDIIKAMEVATGKKIPYKICPRRAGDIDIIYADASKAERDLGWKTLLNLSDICRDAWNWQCKNPNGYNSNNDAKEV